MKQTQAHYCLKQEAGSQTHKLYIYDDVSEYGDFDWLTWERKESETSAEFFRKILEEIPETDTIELHINSYGGSVKEGVAIYNQLKQKKCKEIVAYVDGFAYSIASVIMQAADRRIMGLGTSLLIHNMWTTVSGNSEDLRKAADDLEVLMESNRKIYLDRVNISEEELSEMMDAETYLTPDQAVEMGFADEISEGTKADDAQLIQNMQQSIQQMKRMIAEQKSFKQDMLEFVKSAKQKDDPDDDPDDEDDEKDGETDDEKNAKQRGNKNSIAQLLAQAAQKNLEKGR